MSIGKRIKRLRENNGMTQAEFAKIAGVTDKAVSTWENGTNVPRMGAIQKIADHFHILKSDLIEDKPITERFPPSHLTSVNDIKKRRVPILGTTAAGTPITAEAEYDEYVETPDDGPRYDAALRIEGDSMEPIYCDGDLVFVRYQDDVENGEIAVICLDDTVTLKHIYHVDGGVQLVSANPVNHPPMVFKGEDFNNIHLIGKAVGYLRWFR